MSSKTGDDYEGARKRGGEATKKMMKYHKPDVSSTPSIKGHFRPDVGPLRGSKKNAGLGAKAWCYIHDIIHPWAACPANPDYKGGY